MIESVATMLLLSLCVQALETSLCEREDYQHGSNERKGQNVPLDESADDVLDKVVRTVSVAHNASDANLILSVCSREAPQVEGREGEQER